MTAVAEAPQPMRRKWPLFDASGVEVATHVRVDKPDGDKDVYWVRPDGKKGLGGAPLADLPLYGIHLDLVGRSSTVIITEGEKAAQALLDAGLPAVGTVTGASVVPSATALGDLTGKIVLLWPDADEVGEKHMRGVASNLKAIASKVRWISWPDAQEHDDAFDALARHGRERVLDLLRNAGPVPTGAMKFERRGLGYLGRFADGIVEMTFDRIRVSGGEIKGELRVTSGHPLAPEDGHLLQGTFNVSSTTTRASWGRALKERAPRVDVDWPAYLEQFCVRVLAAEREGLPVTEIGQKPKRSGMPYLLWPILPRDRATIIFGEGGTGKSSFAVACAVTVATGYPVLKGFRVERPGKVLVLDWEADEDEWNDRIGQIAAGIGVEPPSILYRPCINPITDQVEELARLVAENGIELVIVDSTEMASPGRSDGSNANEAVITLFKALRQIGATTLLIDHVSKDGAGKDRGAKNPYGSIFKTNAARSTWELQRLDEDEEEDGPAHLSLINRKLNGGKRHKPIGIRIEYDAESMRWQREDVAEALQKNVPIGDRIIELLRQGAKKPADIATVLDESGNTVRPTLQRLVQRGVAIQLPDGRYALVQR